MATKELVELSYISCLKFANSLLKFAILKNKTNQNKNNKNPTILACKIITAKKILIIH